MRFFEILRFDVIKVTKNFPSYLTFDPPCTKHVPNKLMKFEKQKQKFRKLM